jgi:hypothetical protein
VLGRRRIQEIRGEHIAAVFTRQREQNLAPWTMAGTQTILSAILRFALSRSYISSNPLDRLSKCEKPWQVAGVSRGG